MDQTRSSSSINSALISNHVPLVTEGGGWSSPQEIIPPHISFQQICIVFEWLSQHYQRQPSLAEAVAVANIKIDDFQRCFAQMAGVSPKQILHYLTLNRAKTLLARSRTVLKMAAGEEYGSAPPLDQSLTIEALSPREYKDQSRGLQLRYGFHATPFGECVLVESDRGLYGLAFIGEKSRNSVLGWLCRGLEQTAVVHDDEATADTVRLVFKAPLFGQRPRLRLIVCGTAFQIKVWEALLRIPPGYVAAYADIASSIGDPRAIRAVGTANGHNPIAWLIPCHRVIRNTGALGGYRWGLGSKLAMLTCETFAVQS